MSRVNILQKQNDSIYMSLNNRGIEFERYLVLDSITDDEKIQILLEENSKLKELINKHKPPQQVKQIQTTQTQPSPVKPKTTENDEEEDYSEPVKKFECITNMEDMKRAFFNGDYDTFESAVREHKFPMFEASYKYSSDKDGAPEFVAINLVNGFVRNLEDYRKYLMACFRCNKIGDEHLVKYEYKSYWIVNSLEPLSDIIGSNYEDFDWKVISETEMSSFLMDIRKLADDVVLSEKYLH